ncbi:hypothetical protein BGZ82_005301 [Podila clonocystis]|nr:hypothetical protein BGZ82_005301 [Podila clonocystis]
MFAIYDKSLDTNREELLFTCRWPKGTAKEAPVHFDFDSTLGSFCVIINEEAQEDEISITIEKTDSDRSTLQRFSKCTINSSQGSRTIHCPFVYQYFGEYTLDENIPVSLLEPQVDVFELDFCLTTDASPRPVREPVYEHALLAKAFRDRSTYDVYFLPSENSSNVDSDEPEAYIEPVQQNKPENPSSDKPAKCTVSIQSTESKTSSWIFFFRQTGSSTNAGTTDTLEDSTELTDPREDMSKGQMNKEETENSREGESVTYAPKKIGAHRMILWHWPYFRRLLESASAQNHFGPLTIRLKSTDADTLTIVIRFIYIQMLPTQLSTFQDEEDDDATWTSTSNWEKVFIAAERFKVEELQRIACTKVLHGLSEATAIPFLFRTAYLYSDFRGNVVEYVAQNLHHVVTKRPFRDAYGDHSDFRELHDENQPLECRQPDYKLYAMETLYKASKRYDVDALENLARGKLLGGLNKATSIPFLFRTAYRYTDIRDLAADYVCYNLNSEVKHTFLNTCRHHPDLSDLLTEIFASFLDGHHYRRRHNI